MEENGDVELYSCCPLSYQNISPPMQSHFGEMLLPTIELRNRQLSDIFFNLFTKFTNLSNPYQNGSQLKRICKIEMIVFWK